MLMFVYEQPAHPLFFILLANECLDSSLKGEYLYERGAGIYIVAIVVLDLIAEM
jgi:hypothetical protein